MKFLRRFIGFGVMLIASTSFSIGRTSAQPSPYHELTPLAASIFNTLSQSDWEQFKSIPNPACSESLQCMRNYTWKKILRIGLTHAGHELEFRSPLWTNVESGYASGGGGYAVPVPVINTGYRVSADGTYEFMIWARFTGFVDPDANRLHLDIIEPYVISAQSMAQVREGQQRTCTSDQLAQGGGYACTTTDRSFDYLMIRFNPAQVNRLELLGMDFNRPTAVIYATFSISSTVSHVP